MLLLLLLHSHHLLLLLHHLILHGKLHTHRVSLQQIIFWEQILDLRVFIIGELFRLDFNQWVTEELVYHKHLAGCLMQAVFANLLSWLCEYGRFKLPRSLFFALLLTFIYDVLREGIDGCHELLE